jgi:tRNA-specific 2-thiouridylase
MAGPRIVVAMSGGVDSSVAAALLKDQGFDVVGVSMQLSATPAATVRQGQGCCSLEDFRDARRVADALDIPYYVWNLRDAFRERVTDVFTAEYLRGRTPNPCVLCNRDLKFDELWRRAGTLGADLVATGHYARVREDDGRWRLLRARDEQKDQSYFLFSVTQAELARTRFPLGELTKSEVREEARRRGLPVAEKPESQEICFVPDRDYAGWVERHATADALRPGPVVDEQGKQLATHGGVHRFTVGQRRGLGIGDGVARWVSRVDGATGTVHVGGKDALGNRGLVAEQVSWAAGTPAAGDGAEPVRVRIRHRHTPVAARLTHTAVDRVEAWFDEPASAVTPGQAAVFYRGDEVLGGGWIAEAL